MNKINIKFYFKFILFINFLFLFGCTGVKEKIGIINKSPDEFQVYEKKPLDIPPNFELRPPIDGDKIVADSEDENIIFNEEVNTNESLTIEDEVLLISIGDKDSDKDIREMINNENSIREIEKPLLDKILDFDTIIEVNKEENDELDPNVEKERINQLKEEGKLIDAQEEERIIDELRSDIKDIENNIEEVENNNFEETTSQNTLSEADENRKNNYKKKIDEEKSFIDKIFDFDLFSSEDKELESINQRERTFFERKKVESDDDKERIISNKNERGNSSKDEDKVIDAVISEKEGSID
tara:strand:- start:212 stop:1105 length:894 start_codon:yes stop_codon:yes gene_type:complete